jgi:XTP/dITP diphosphohydrolase
MSLPHTIVFATSNPHKLEEVAAVLGEAGVKVRGLEAIGKTIAEPEETGLTFIDNAILKARYYAQHAGSGAVVLADDSGLEVDALGGAPGVHSARYAGVTGPRSVVDPANNAKLVAQLREIPEGQRSARFVCAMAMCDAKQTIAVVRGTIEGRMVLEPRGSNGFGYDPLFFVDEVGCTTAELPPEKKNAISHRGKATRMMLGVLKQLA